jgi:hypothetical protein
MTNTLLDIINNATLNDAKAYERTEEKFTFCIDMLEISADDNNADFWVNKLENRFETLLKDFNTKFKTTYKVGERVEVKGLGTGTVIGFEDFDDLGNSVEVKQTEPGNPSRVVVKLDNPERWAFSNMNPYVFRSDLKSLEGTENV